MNGAKMNNRTFIIVAIILIGAAIIANTPPKFDAKSEIQMSTFPKEIGEWKGEDLPISERDYEILETRNLIMRDYKNSSGDSVYLYIIYSADNRRSLHPPEVCYTGGGSTILEKSVVPITAFLRANQFIIELKDSKQLVVYWFKAPNLDTYSYLKQQLKVMADRMLRKQTYGAMVRVSTIVKDNNQGAALKLVKRFCVEIEPFLEKYLP
jgi:EpsI family protein